MKKHGQGAFSIVLPPSGLRGVVPVVRDRWAGEGGYHCGGGRDLRAYIHKYIYIHTHTHTSLVVQNPIVVNLKDCCSNPKRTLIKEPFKEPQSSRPSMQPWFRASGLRDLELRGFEVVELSAT